MSHVCFALAQRLLIFVKVSDPQGLEVEAGSWAARNYH